MKKLKTSGTQVCQILAIVVFLTGSAVMIHHTLSLNGLFFTETIPAKLPLRRGMAMEEVRKIMGEPRGISALESHGTLRQDWWYSSPTVQLTFINGRLESDHSKALQD